MSSTAETANLTDTFRSFCHAHGNKLDSTWVIAYSGGCDSTALAASAVQVVGESGGAVVLAHLDHGIRSPDECTIERDHVRRFADDLGCVLHQHSIANGILAQTAQQTGDGIEACARLWRYRFLLEACERYSAACLATGHHCDDNAETVLMRLLRGSGGVGLSGIPAVSEQTTGTGRTIALVRPFLTVERASIVRFCRDRKIAWIEDRSNQSDEALRNRIRTAVIPQLRRIEPNATRNIAITAGKIGDIQEALRFAASDAVGSLQGPKVEIESGRFVRYPPALRAAALFLALQRLIGDAAASAIPRRFFAPLLGGDIVLPSVAERPVILRGHGLVVRADRDVIRLCSDIVRYPKKGYLVHSSGNASFTRPDEFSMMIEIVVSGKPAASTVILRGTRYAPPVVARSRRPGDSIELEYGRKRLKKLFNEQRSENVAVIPVVEDRNGIVAVLFSPWGGPDVVRHDVMRIDDQECRSEQMIRLRWKGDSAFEESTEQQTGT